MNLYRVIRITDEHVLGYHGTRDAAHDDAKCHLPRADSIRIELVTVPTDKAGLLRMLNSVCDGAADSLSGIELVSTWALTNRGGLKEVANGQ